MIADRYTPQDLIAAAPDAIAMALGERPSAPHPLAELMAENPLSSLADAAARKNTRPGSSARASGFNTQDFGAALATGIQRAITRRFEASAEHRQFCGELELKDFRPVDFPELDISDELPPLLELGEIVTNTPDYPLNLNIGESVRDARVASFARVIGISRQVIVNDQIGVVADLLKLMASAAARTEARLLYNELELNPNLADGYPIFIAGENWVQSAFDETSLASGIALMRNFETPSGNRADIPAAFLVVAPDLEFPARKLVHQAGQPLEVIASANLAAGHWYLVSNPDIHPACAVLKLRGTRNPVRVESKNSFATDGANLKAAADLGAVIRGRMGIVRGGVA